MPEPSNNDFRIAGAMGIDPNPTDSATQEVLTQGLGFPLRPISGVPLKGTPDIEDLVAVGVPMQWMGDWDEGKIYPRGAYLRDGDFTLVANKPTLEKPAPVPDPNDPESTGLPDPWVGAFQQANTSVVVSGQTYTFSQAGWIKELKVYVTELSATTNYRIVILDTTNPETPVTRVIDDPILVENEWKVISLLNLALGAGTVLTISIDALNSGSDTSVDGGWIYQGSTQTGAPPPQNWTVDNQRSTFRIDKTDLDGTDRGTELEGVIPETTIAVVQTDNTGLTSAFRVNSVIDQGTYMEYIVVLQAETGGGVQAGAVTTVEIDIPISLATEYAEETAVWGTPPSWASSVSGFLAFDGVDQGVPTTNAYGVDILFQPASISEDWDIVSLVR